MRYPIRYRIYEALDYAGVTKPGLKAFFRGLLVGLAIAVIVFLLVR